MKKKNMNAFTLVELLAVIVILAIILVIAVPKVMSVIEDSKKATLESTAKMIASAAEKAKVQNTVLGKEDAITCESVAKINNLDYDTCSIKFDDNTAKVTIKGKGKFAGLHVCSGTKTEAEAIDEECSSNTLISHIQALYNNETTRLSNGLTKDNTVDENIRYSGSDEVVKNYVEFGNVNELWRIIGIFEVETEKGTEELVKIVREESIGNMLWDTSDSTINAGKGINQWGESTYIDSNGDEQIYAGSDLMQLLNGKYLNKQEAQNACYDIDKEEYGTCNFSSTGMSSTYKSMVETVTWKTSAIDVSTITNQTEMTMSTTGWYNAERGTLGKICTEGNYCNDTVARTGEWEGLVALLYGSDYVYATSESDCRINMLANLDIYTFSTMCKNNNWMSYEDDDIIGFLSPIAHTGGAYNVAGVAKGGFVSNITGNYPIRTHPTLYLKANVEIEDGIGTDISPYKLKI